MKEYMLQLGQKARAASIEMSRAESSVKNQALLAIANAIDNAAETLKPNNLFLLVWNLNSQKIQKS